jgi:hypothetical protein
MERNRIQCQKGFLLPEFEKLYGTQAHCEAPWRRLTGLMASVSTLRRASAWSRLWPLAHALPVPLLRPASHPDFPQDHAGNKAAADRLVSGLFLVGQAKTGISLLEISRHLGVNYYTAWLLHNKSLQVMSEREESYLLQGKIQMDDA